MPDKPNKTIYIVELEGWLMGQYRQVGDEVAMSDAEVKYEGHKVRKKGAPRKTKPAAPKAPEPKKPEPVAAKPEPSDDKSDADDSSDK